jgi:hypothetical protein
VPMMPRMSKLTVFRDSAGRWSMHQALGSQAVDADLAEGYRTGEEQWQALIFGVPGDPGITVEQAIRARILQIPGICPTKHKPKS